MAIFLIDEDMPRSTGRELAVHGNEIIDIRDHGLRGVDDNRIYEFAQEHKAILVTGDRGFGNILKFPPGVHHGIIIVHLPNEMTTGEMNRVLLDAVRHLSEEEIRGNLIIIEPGKIRIRRSRSKSYLVPE